MTRIHPIPAASAQSVVACLATLALALAACTSVNPSISPSASTAGSAGTGPAASQAPTASQTAVTASPAHANQPQTIHVLEPAKNVTQVSVGSLTGCTSTKGCQGDYVLGDDPLLDATTKQEVGRLLFECFRVDTGSSLFHCPGNTITLTGRGQIVYTEDVHFAAGYTLDQWPITGGTGEFVGATGFVTSPADSTYTDGGDFVITIAR
jgi:hypothetical protein